MKKFVVVLLVLGVVGCSSLRSPEKRKQGGVTVIVTTRKTINGHTTEQWTNYEPPESMIVIEEEKE